MLIPVIVRDEANPTNDRKQIFVDDKMTRIRLPVILGDRIEWKYYTIRKEAKGKRFAIPETQPARSAKK